MSRSFRTRRTCCYDRHVARSGWRIVAVAAVGWGMAVGVPSGCSVGPGAEPGRDDLGFLAVATVACDRLVECGCLSLEEAGFCANEFSNVLVGVEGAAYDDACAQAWRRWWSTASCTDPVYPEIGDVCPIYHGAQFEGLPCEAEGALFTDCGPQLWCIGGTCVDPVGLPLGGRDELCDPLHGCDDGLACSGGRCLPPPGPGQPCADGRCAEGSRCEAPLDFEAPSLCVAGGEVGSPCMGHAECASFNCPAGFCIAPSTVGDPCSSTLPCGPGLSCEDGICQGAGASGFCASIEIALDG